MTSKIDQFARACNFSGRDQQGVLSSCPRTSQEIKVVEVLSYAPVLAGSESSARVVVSKNVMNSKICSLHDGRITCHVMKPMPYLFGEFQKNFGRLT